VVNLSPQDFAMTGTLTASDLFRTIPQFNVNPGPGRDTGGEQRARHARQPPSARYRLGAPLADDDRRHALSATG
jgi:hypothetical protein